MSDDDVLGASIGDFHPTLYALVAVVYAEREGQILLLEASRRGVRSWYRFLPGGAVDPGELPEAAADRELVEESGLRIDGELELVGVYPMRVYGGDCLQLSYRARCRRRRGRRQPRTRRREWIDPVEYRAGFADELIAVLAVGNERVSALVQNVRDYDAT